mmetsp:Transcript_19679/g.37285  ORF Transcript_19679/g.37285 Transcript_19679/m.37285 type:complete len:84 (+) Transcript_19679:2603-2854(+)|eukprot:scaffold2069_cov187-Amphora_coffeaeformis.AAC.38
MAGTCYGTRKKTTPWGARRENETISFVRWTELVAMENVNLKQEQRLRFFVRRDDGCRCKDESQTVRSKGGSRFQSNAKQKGLR